MKWVTYQQAGHTPGAGVLVGESVHGLAPEVTLLGLIVGGALWGADALRRPAEIVPLADVHLLAPIPEPPSVRDAVGFLEHVRNTRRVTDGPPLEPVWEETPAFSSACPTDLLGPRVDVPMAPGSTWFDLELEVAAVVGAGGRDLIPASAERSVGRCRLHADVRLERPDQQVGELQQGVAKAKAKDSGTTFGPALVTVDELEPYRRDGRLAPSLSAAVNGEVLTTGHLDDMDWTFGDILAFSSRGVDLRPGDLIGSGTVPGGCLLEHLDTDPATFTRWLRPRDVSLRADGLGETRQKVVAGAPYDASGQATDPGSGSPAGDLPT